MGEARYRAIADAFAVFDETEAPPDPYRAGLDSAARISSLAWEAEQAMYRAAEQSQREQAE